MGKVFADLYKFDSVYEHQIAAASSCIALEAMGKVGMYTILALAFVPQWTSPSAVDPHADCSSLWSVRIFGESSLTCLQRRLPLERRREFFRATTKGPFCVAPFIGILVKVMIPLVADRLDEISRRVRCACCPVWVDDASDGLFRILSLIFAYDGDHIGCLSFVRSGYPFTKVSAALPGVPERGDDGEDLEDLVLEGDPAARRTQHAMDALDQSVRKLFEPPDELLELKLNFMFVVFFAPIRPFGVLPTLGARLLEVHTDLAKMLFVRRRPFPEDGAALHGAQEGFCRIVMPFALVWSLLLSLITYNDDLWRWVA